MYKYLTITVSLLIFAMACNGQKAEFSSEGANYFGAKITDKGFTNLAQVDLPNMQSDTCLLYTSPSPRDRTRSRMPSSA